MSPEEALQVLDLCSRLAPLNYEDQVRRCSAVDVLKGLLPKEEEPAAEPAPPEPKAADDKKPVRKGAK